MKHFIVAGFASMAATAWACHPEDLEISRYTQMATQPCEGPGTCYAMDLNPDTGSVEYYYGTHPNCDGHQDQPRTTTECQTPEKSIYIENEVGSFGECLLLGSGMETSRRKNLSRR